MEDFAAVIGTVLAVGFVIALGMGWLPSEWSGNDGDPIPFFIHE
jgi:hypothetical protein